MDGTTIETVGPVGPVTIEVGPVAANAAPVVNILKGVGWFGLGVIAYAVEGTEWLIKTATDKGKEIGPSVAKPIQAAGDAVEETLGDVGTRLKDVGMVVGRRAEAIERAMADRFAAVVERAGAPIVAEVGELKARVEELSKKIEDLQTKRDKPEKQ